MWVLRPRGLPARHVTVNRETPMLLPPDLRAWVPADHLVPFMIDAVGELAPRHERKARLQQARAEIEARAFAWAQEERRLPRPG